MSWGLAEEAGFAAGWMASRGLDGAGLVARQLHTAQEHGWSNISPVVERGSWRAVSTGYALCPITSGASLSDYLSVDNTLFDGTGLRVSRVSFPGLLLPFIGLVANAMDTSLCVQFQHGIVCVSADGALIGDVSKLMAVAQQTLVVASSKGEIECTQRTGESKPESTSKAASDTQATGTIQEHEQMPVKEFTPKLISTWPYLYKLSMRTTVPASEVSRGNAGASGGDND